MQKSLVILKPDCMANKHAGNVIDRFEKAGFEIVGAKIIRLSAEVPNPRGQLLPGLYVRVKVEQAQAPAAVLLPQQAVSRGGQGDSMRVVGDDGIVTMRPVKIGSAREGQWVILDGLKPGEKVMVDGFQKLRGGKGPVKPVPWQPAPAAGSATPAPAPAPAAGPAAPAAR